MKLEIIVVFTKGWCLMTGAMAAAIAAGITQIETGVLFGVSVKVWALFLGAYSVGCNGLVAFLSQSFGEFKAQVRANAGQPPMPPPPAQVPVVGKAPIADGQQIK
jgi:hypothetical protein